MIIKTIAFVLIFFLGSIKAAYYSLPEDLKAEMPIEYKAYVAEMTVDEFSLMSAVVEAESNRETDEDAYEGRVLIALTILNRVESSQFNNSITSVISESGQFQVYYEGTYKDVGRTDLSDMAVLEAVKWCKEDHPNVIYFNCIGYNYLGTPYCYCGGNYFETL